MLVLSRKKGEKIVIGSGIEVVVIDISKKRVRIGIVAPAEVPVHREEVARRLALEAAVAVGPVCDRNGIGESDIDRLQACPADSVSQVTMDFNGAT